MRVVQLTEGFYRTRRIHAPHGSPADAAVRVVLRQLENGKAPLPGDDPEALRTPPLRVWSRAVPGTALVLTYAITPPGVRVLSVHPAYRAV